MPRFAPVLMVVALLALPPMAQAAPEAILTEGKAGDGTRYYQDAIIIHAPAATLWAAYTETEAYRKWTGLATVAIEFRLGGSIEASYDPKGHLGDKQNIKNEFIAYIPGKLLVFRNIQAPDALPGKSAYPKTVKTLEFDPLGGDLTKVTVSGIGFGVGPDFDQLYQFFAKGDGEMLEALYQAFNTP